MHPAYLARLEHQPTALNHLLAGCSEAQLRQRPQPETWSVFETIAHLGRYQEVFLDRLHTMLTEDGPTFTRYVAEQDAGFDEWLTKPYSKLMGDLEKSRAVLNQTLQKLSDEQLLRTGKHPLYGPLTLVGWTEFFLLHEAHHFFTILKLTGPMRQENYHNGSSAPS